MLIINSIPKSSYIKGFEWVGEQHGYPDPGVKGDTYPITWAADDNLYTSAGDPLWGETTNGLDVEVIKGTSEDYIIEKINPMNDFLGWGGAGPKPTGMICVDNVLYLAVQNLRGMQFPSFGLNSQHGSDAGILYCYSPGNWSPAFQNIKAPMFPGSKFGGPAFINFGKNNENARDEYVYAVSGDQWDNGSNLRLGRVRADCILRAESWEWVCAYDTDGTPVFWPKLDEAIPILSIHQCVSAPDMAYVKGINRYLLFTWRLHKDFSPDAGSDLIVMESPEPWGPFSLVHIEENWESKEMNPYCPRLPLKWMDADGTSGTLLFSGSWGPEAQAKKLYRAHTRKFRFLMA